MTGRTYMPSPAVAPGSRRRCARSWLWVHCWPRWLVDWWRQYCSGRKAVLKLKLLPLFLPVLKLKLELLLFLFLLLLCRFPQVSAFPILAKRNTYQRRVHIPERVAPGDIQRRQIRGLRRIPYPGFCVHDPYPCIRDVGDGFRGVHVTRAVVNLRGKQHAGTIRTRNICPSGPAATKRIPGRARREYAGGQR